MNTPVIDQKARDMAQAATSAITMHEKICAQRWLSTMDTMRDIKRIIAWATTGLIGSMAGLIVWLATHSPY